MGYSLWVNESGDTAVSASEYAGRPVIGYIVPLEDGKWSIRGDVTSKVYGSQEEAASALMQVWLASPPESNGELTPDS